MEFVETLLYHGVSPENIGFLTDCPHKAQWARKNAYNGLNVILRPDMIEFLNKMGEANVKFDIVVGNPPYQTQSNVEFKTTQPIWGKFVEKACELTKNGGYICLVHPSGWRDVDGKFKPIQILIKSKRIAYLEIHDRNDGVKTFGVQTAYDWYVLQNVDPIGKTIIKSQNGDMHNVDLNDIGFIPNDMFDVVDSLLAKNGEKSVKSVRSCDYHTQKTDKVSRAKHDGFVYPCVYSILKDSTINLYYSNENSGGCFGVPKVIFTNGTSYPTVDRDGIYGLTEFAYAIIDSKDNLELIQKAMLTSGFIEVMNACQLIGKHRYNWRIISQFRHDFWRSFVNEDGTEKV
jgi:hypothetical protein